MLTALTAAALLTPYEQVKDALVLLEDGVITFAGTRREHEIPAGAQVEDFGHSVLAPGYCDIHIHGAAGHDVMHASGDELAAVERLLATHGVTSYCPTTVTAPHDVTLRALERLAGAIESAAGNHAERAQPIGIHLEGPFISHAKRGVHPPAEIRQPSIRLFDEMFGAARGHVALMTIAPEASGAAELIEHAVKKGVRVSMGHSNADAAATRAAIAAGASHATHTFNAMRALDHREPGILGEVLATPSLSADMIVDGVHVHPDVVRIFLQMKGAEMAVLITDAISATGMGDGEYRLGPFTVRVVGERCTSAEGKLAGSVLTMDRAVRNVMDFAGWELRAAVQLASANPAAVICSGGARGGTRSGTLKTGSAADIVVLTSSGEVVETIVGGRMA
jgi:N-acetylglucosamine-6-phosphate deacetylase